MALPSSTYASIISTLLHREYVILETKRFKPTDVGKIVNKFLNPVFYTICRLRFYGEIRRSLDEVSRGEKQWVPLMSEFWRPFIDLVHSTEENVQRKDVTAEALDEQCPKCGKPLSIRPR